MYATPSATPTPPNYAQTPARTPSRRPASIGELAERALDNLWDDRKELKFYLRQAEQYRKDGKTFAAHGDHENAFVSFARAATLVLDKLPTHRDYRTMLSDKHRHNLGLVRGSLGPRRGAPVRTCLLIGYCRTDRTSWTASASSSRSSSSATNDGCKRTRRRQKTPTVRQMRAHKGFHLPASARHVKP